MRQLTHTLTYSLDAVSRPRKTMLDRLLDLRKSMEYATDPLNMARGLDILKTPDHDAQSLVRRYEALVASVSHDVLLMQLGDLRQADLRLAEALKSTGVDIEHPMPQGVRVLQAKVSSAAKKMERSKAIFRENSGRWITYEAYAKGLERSEHLKEQSVAAETSTAEQRRAKRREALMKMRALWQESNPDGMIDGVEYQKAMRAE